MPGAIVFARTPSGPPSTASWRVMARIAPLPAQCAVMASWRLPRNALTEAKLITDARPAATRYGQAAWQVKNTRSISPVRVGRNSDS